MYLYNIIYFRRDNKINNARNRRVSENLPLKRTFAAVHHNGTEYFREDNHTFLELQCSATYCSKEVVMFLSFIHKMDIIT